MLGWNSRQFTMIDHFIGTFSVSTVLADKATCTSWIISSVYGPSDSRLRGRFWCELDSIRSRWVGPWCIRGDWNITRFPSEKLDGGSTTAEMEAFLDWIDYHLLVDLQLGGAKFTRSNHQNPPMLSRLDRFLEIGLNCILKLAS